MFIHKSAIITFLNANTSDWIITMTFFFTDVHFYSLIKLCQADFSAPYCPRAQLQRLLMLNSIDLAGSCIKIKSHISIQT